VHHNAEKRRQRAEYERSPAGNDISPGWWRRDYVDAQGNRRRAHERWYDDSNRQQQRVGAEMHWSRPTEDVALYRIRIEARSVATVANIYRTIAPPSGQNSLFRWCFSCHEYKPPSAFDVSHRGDGVNSYCKQCTGDKYDHMVKRRWHNGQ
jgi:hypothetical protein